MVAGWRWARAAVFTGSPSRPPCGWTRLGLAERRRGEGCEEPMSAAAVGLGVLGTALAGVVAVLSSRVSERLRIPAPAFFLIAAAAAADLWPRLGGLSFSSVDQVVSVSLVVILFDGGMRVGWRRMKSVAGPTLWIGVAGTLVTAGGV